MTVKISAPISYPRNQTQKTHYKGVVRSAEPLHSIISVDNLDFVEIPSSSRPKPPSHRTNAWSNLPMLDEARLIHYGTEALPKSTTLIPSLLVSSHKLKTTNQIVSEINNSQDLTFIPLVLESSYSFLSPILPKSFIPRHVVLIIVDKKKGTIEYFDSKGKDPMKETRAISNYEGSLPTLLGALKKGMGNSYQGTTWNKVRFQSDSSSCGYFVGHVMKERPGSSFEEITNSYMDIDSIRDEIDAHDQTNGYINLKVESESTIDLKSDAIDDEFEGL